MGFIYGVKSNFKEMCRNLLPNIPAYATVCAITWTRRLLQDPWADIDHWSFAVEAQKLLQYGSVELPSEDHIAMNRGPLGRLLRKPGC